MPRFGRLDGRRALEEELRRAVLRATHAVALQEARRALLPPTWPGPVFRTRKGQDSKGEGEGDEGARAAEGGAG